MTYIITEPCVGVKDASCVAVCPVDCIVAEDEDQNYFINPDECIDCGACVPECPVDAIYAEDEVPEELKDWTPVNFDYFTDERGEFYAKYAPLFAAAKEKNRGSEHALEELYNTPGPWEQ